MALFGGRKYNQKHCLVMTKEQLLKLPLWQYTGEQLLELLNSRNETPQNEVKPESGKQRKYVYGIKGLCDLLKCSKATASRIKKKGILKDAITQIGRKIITDVEIAMECIRVAKEGGAEWDK